MICFYRNTVDSCACANLLSIHMKNRDKKSFILYNGLENMQLPHLTKEEIWFVGIPLTERDCPYIETLLNNQNKIIWYDNHKSSLLHRNDSLSFTYSEINTEISSSFNLFLKLNCTVICPNAPYYIKLINDFETATVNDKINHDAQAFIYGMMKEDYSPLSPIWDTFFNNFQTAHNIRQNGNIILEYLKRDTEECINNMGYLASFNGISYICINQKVEHRLVKNRDRVVSWYRDDDTYYYTISSRVEGDNLLKLFSGFDDIRGDFDFIQFTSKKLIFEKCEE